MKNNSKFKLIFLAAILTATGCKHSSSDMDTPIVTVGNKVLTRHELSNAIPPNTTPEDSVMIADDYVKRWINSELMLNKALLNLTKEEQNIDYLIEEYRRSLLVNLYQQKLLDQKYSPMITDGEIKQYYNTMKENFILKENIFKGVLAIIPKSTPRIGEFKQWLRFRNGDDIINAKAFMLQFGPQSVDFLDKWMTVSYVNSLLPGNIPSENDVLRYRRFYETEDSQNHYFVVVTESKFTDDYEPVEFASDKIKSILLNKKRFEFIKQLEEDIYNEGLEQKTIKFN